MGSVGNSNPFDFSKAHNNANPNARKLAKSYGIDLQQFKTIDEEVLISQIEALNGINNEFPQVMKLLNTSPALFVDKLDSTEYGDEMVAGSDSFTKRIILNSESALFNKDIANLRELSEKRGRIGKFGSHQSSQSIQHPTVHEFGHLMQYALQSKSNKSLYETLNDAFKVAMKNSGLKSLPTNISSYSNANHKELFSESIADAYLNGNKASKFSKELYRYCKEKLG